MYRPHLEKYQWHVPQHQYNYEIKQRQTNFNETKFNDKKEMIRNQIKNTMVDLKPLIIIEYKELSPAKAGQQLILSKSLPKMQKCIH